MAFGFDGDGRERAAGIGQWGGFRYGRLLEPDTRAAALDVVSGQVEGHPRVAATSAILLLGWASRIWMATLLLDGRVPLSSLADASTDPTAESVDGSVVLAHGRFACLPDDVAAGHPDATVVTDRAALQRTFHELVTDALLAPFLETLARRGPVGRRPLAGMIGSRWASTAAMLARGPQERAAMTAVVRGVVAGHPLTRPVAPVIHEVPRGGGRALAHVRATCCLFYQLEGGEMCEGSCPLTPSGLAMLRASRTS